MYKQIKTSRYLHLLRENSGLLAISLIVAGICVFISYPGVVYGDTYYRVNLGYLIKESIKIFRSTGQWTLDYSSWLTPAPSYFIALSYLITGDFVAYNFFIAAFVFFITLLFLKKICKRYSFAAYMVALCCPVILCASVYMEQGVACAAGIAAIILLLFDEGPVNGIDRVINFILVAFCSFLIFGYRQNAFTILPVIFVYIFFRMAKSERIRNFFAVISGLILVWFIPKLLNIDTMPTAASGFVWDMVTAIQRMEPEKQEKYIDYLDDIGGKGSTKEAVEISSQYATTMLVYYSDLNKDVMNKDGNFGKIMDKYVNFIIKEPADWAKVKLGFAFDTLGINHRLDHSLFSEECGYYFNATAHRTLFIELYNRFVDLFYFVFLKPWIFFLLNAAALLYLYYKKSNNSELFLFVFLISIFYYGGFLLNTQAFELRYFYPSMFILLLCDISIAVLLVGDTFKTLLKLLKKMFCATKGFE